MNLSEKTSFDWDRGNLRKNEKHGVTREEVEQVFAIYHCSLRRMCYIRRPKRASTQWV